MSRVGFRFSAFEFTRSLIFLGLLRFDSLLSEIKESGTFQSYPNPGATISPEIKEQEVPRDSDPFVSSPSSSDLLSSADLCTALLTQFLHRH